MAAPDNTQKDTSNPVDVALGASRLFVGVSVGVFVISVLVMIMVGRGYIKTFAHSTRSTLRRNFAKQFDPQYQSTEQRLAATQERLEIAQSDLESLGKAKRMSQESAERELERTRQSAENYQKMLERDPGQLVRRAKRQRQERLEKMQEKFRAAQEAEDTLRQEFPEPAPVPEKKWFWQ